MKKLSKITLLLAALFLTMTLAACSKGSSSSEDEPSKTEPTETQNTDNTQTADSITYTATSDSNSSVNYKFIFTTDGKFTNSSAYNSYAEEIEYSGTYTGDASKDGTVEITILKQRKDHNGNMEDYTGSEATQNLTISSRKFTFNGDEYTRQ